MGGSGSTNKCLTVCRDGWCGRWREIGRSHSKPAGASGAAKVGHVQGTQRGVSHEIPTGEEHVESMVSFIGLNGSSNRDTTDHRHAGNP